MKNMIAIALATLLLTGCASNHKNGDCITEVEGTCLLVYVDGESVPSGDVDMRFTGLKSVNGELSGTVRTKSNSW